MTAYGSNEWFISKAPTPTSSTVTGRKRKYVCFRPGWAEYELMDEQTLLL
jgi:hypothetical protein